MLPRFPSAVKGVLPPKVVERAAIRSLPSYIVHAGLETLRSSKYSCIFCGHLNMAPLAVILSRLSGAPIWLQLHGIEAWTKPSEIVRRSVEQASLTTCVSRHTRRRFLDWADVQPQRVLVLPNTVGEQFVLDGPEESIVDRYGLSGRSVMLSVSRLSRCEGYKGQDRVIRCMPELLEEFENLVFVIAGEGDLVEDLEVLAESLGVEEAVKFVGPVRHSDLPALYRDADVFVMPSTGEGFGIVFLEAIACGTPVIAGVDDGARDPLQDGVLGALSSAKELSSSIRAALTGNRRVPNWHQLQATRAESVTRHFGRPAFSAQAESILHRITDRAYV
jgi:phosphatidylinositol alpha-1,6-mannosyltransferase